jgi:Grx4 family monothiol glutaredoxin
MLTPTTARRQATVRILNTGEHRVRTVEAVIGHYAVGTFQAQFGDLSSRKEELRTFIESGYTMSVTAVNSLAEFNAVQKGNRCMIFFWASWHEPSAVGGQMQGVFSALSSKYPDVRFMIVEAEAHPDISERFGVAVVPTFFATNNGTEVGKVEGANPAELSKLAKKLVEQDAGAAPSVPEPETQPIVDLNTRLKQLIDTDQVMLFMKGSPSEPRCGFSRKIVEVLNSNGIAFSSFDILTDQDVREGLKKYSDWPTFPQLYVKSELVGGLDIVKEMAEGGDLKSQFGV